jgi:hypothetical protein
MYVCMYVCPVFFCLLYREGTCLKLGRSPVQGFLPKVCDIHYRRSQILHLTRRDGLFISGWIKEGEGGGEGGGEGRWYWWWWRFKPVVIELIKKFLILRRRDTYTNPATRPVLSMFNPIHISTHDSSPISCNTSLRAYTWVSQLIFPPKVHWARPICTYNFPFVLSQQHLTTNTE